MESQNLDIRQKLIEKAEGYSVKEIVEEYGDVNGELVLLKKKITHRFIPPDVSLIKLLLEDETNENDDLSKYTEEELKKMLKLLVLEGCEENDKT
jgi:hypothetical protein